MTSTVPTDVPDLPTARTCPFEPPAELERLREEQPISRLRFPDGTTGWLATRHADIRAVLADPRFSSAIDKRKAVVRRPLAAEDEPAALDPKRLKGFFIAMDAPEHTRYRRLLTGQFTVRRMKALEPRVEQIVDEHLDRMEAAGPTADLVKAFALPIPSLVICELLGVPPTDQGRFQHDTSVLLSLTATAAEAIAAWDSIHDFLLDLVRHKRTHPDEQLISGLIADSDLDDAELTGIAMLLLIAGHETTANMLGLGTFALLENPDQLARLRAEPETVNNAVEELLRYLTIIQFGTTRAALEDVEVGGITVKADETIALSLPAGNRDDDRFDDADTLDITRHATGHLTFGHGVHQCLGQQLARIEMRIAFTKLFQRFENLALAVPADQVPLRTDMSIYGVHELPVTW